MHKKVEIATESKLEIQLRGLEDRREEINVKLYEDELSRRKKLKIHRRSGYFLLGAILLFAVFFVLTITAISHLIFVFTIGLGIFAFLSIVLTLIYLFQINLYRENIKKKFLPPFIRFFYTQF